MDYETPLAEINNGLNMAAFVPGTVVGSQHGTKEFKQVGMSNRHYSLKLVNHCRPKSSIYY